MRVCGSGDVRRRRLPCRLGKAVYWRAALRLGHATIFAAARWRRAHCGPRRGTSSCRYRCRSRRSRYWVSETWRAPCLWCPLPASLAGGAGARPDHPISCHQTEAKRDLGLRESLGGAATFHRREPFRGSDRIDTEALLRSLMAYLRGEPKVWSVVPVPSVAEEDARRLHRERCSTI